MRNIKNRREQNCSIDSIARKTFEKTYKDFSELMLSSGVMSKKELDNFFEKIELTVDTRNPLESIINIKKKDYL